MKIYREIVFDLTSFDDDGKMAILSEDSFEYDGPIAHAGGGPSSEQKAAAKSQAALDTQSAENSKEGMQIQKEQLAKINPFATSRMNNGLPFYGALTDYASGTNAQAFAPAHAALLRHMKNYGSLPSGFKTQALADFDAQRAMGYDSMMAQNLSADEQARNNAAGMLVGQQQIANPIGWAQTAGSGNSSIMNAPLASPGLSGLIGGLAGSIPF